MRSGNLKKYLIPNLPYVFLFWCCLKLGTAYRLAAGANLAQKLVGTVAAIGPAFADFAPGLNGFDWLIGLLGVAAIRLFVYCKAKNAKKYRRDVEYGSARWGGPKDIAPFTDPVFKNNVILTGTEFLTTNTRPKIPGNARNLNCCVIGSSGSGKTRFWLTPQLLQAHSSYVVVDPKGGTLEQCGAFLLRQGYKVKVFNSIDFSKSMHYNPLAYIRNEADILKFVDTLIANTKGDGKEGDPFWTKAETLLYCALIAYIIFEGAPEDRNLNTLVDMIPGMEVKENDENYMNAVDYMFSGLEKRKPNCFAVKQYKKYKLASGKTSKSILVSTAVRLAPFNFLVSLLYAQAFQALYYSADQIHHGALPCHVHFVLDEFASMPMPGFTRELATMRSRSISASTIIQNLAQIKELFKDSWETIPGNSDTILYLGGNESSTHKYISEALGKSTINTKTHGQSKGRSGSWSTNFQTSGRELLTPDEVRALDNRYAILFIRGAKPVMDLKYDLMKHPAIGHTVDGGGPPYIHHQKKPKTWLSGAALFARSAGTEIEETEHEPSEKQ